MSDDLDLDAAREVTVGKYIIRELSVGAMIPIIDMAASTDEAVRRDFQLQLLKLSVFNLDGTPFDTDKVPFRVYMKLLPEVLSVNGLSGSVVGEKALGNV